MNDGLLVPTAASTSCWPTALLANANSDVMALPRTNYWSPLFKVGELKI
jgi:hypothetical protein